MVASQELSTTGGSLGGKGATIAPDAASSFLRVLPAQLEFEAVQTHDAQHAPRLLSLRVRNVSPRARTLRVLRPALPVFRLAHSNNSQTLRLAPGLEAAIEVIFEPPNNTTTGPEGGGGEGGVGVNDTLKHDYFDTLLVEEGCVGVPLVGRVGGVGGGEGQLSVEPAALDFGYVPMGGQDKGEGGVDGAGRGGEKVFSIVNRNRLAATPFEVEYDREAVPVDVDPRSGTIPPASRQEVVARLASSGAAGAVYGRVNVRASPEGRAVPVEVTAVAVPAAFDVVTDIEPNPKATTNTFKAQRQPLLALAFPPLCHGESHVLPAAVHNAGPNPITYTATLALSTSSPSPTNDNTDSNSTATNNANPTTMGFSISPASGTVPPFSFAPFTVTFAPKQQDRAKGFATLAEKEPLVEDLTCALNVTSDGSPETPLRLPLVVSPSIAISFGATPTSTCLDTLVSLQSQTAVPLSFTLSSSSPSFAARPGRGRLQPGQSADMVLTFAPRALGTHRETVRVRVWSTRNEGVLLHELTLSVHGSAPLLGPRINTLGGPDKIREDFIRPRHYVDPDAPAEFKLKPFERKHPWEEEHLGPITDFTMLAEDLEKQHMHRTAYVSYLRASRSLRDKRSLPLPPPEDDLHLGMRPAAGLAPPVLPLPQGPTAGAAVVVRPDTEMMAPPSDIVKVAVGPRVLDFGPVSATAQTTRWLTVSNGLTRAVLVHLNLESCPDLTETSPHCQVVGPGATAGFNVVLVSNAIGAFRRTVAYSINGAAHTFYFDVKADVVPVSLKLSREEVDFTFSPDNWDPSVQETIVITNTNAHAVSFWWEGAGERPPSSNPTGNTPAPPAAIPFTVSPQHGEVQKKASLPVTITWAPGVNSTSGSKGALAGGAAYEGSITLMVRGGGGAGKRVRLRGEKADGHCGFKEKEGVDFGIVSTGMPHARTVTLKNPAGNDAVFLIDQASLQGVLKVTPDRGRVSGGTTLEMELVLEPTTKGPVDIRVKAVTRGGDKRGLELAVKAEAVVPSVTVEQGEISFGGVYIGGAARHDLSLNNTSSVPASLVLDLADRPEFALDYGPETTEVEQEEEEHDSDDQDLPPGSLNRYAITLAPNQKLKLAMVFRPRRIASAFSFPLPLTIAGGNGDNSQLARSVSAQGLKPRLLLSKTGVEFGSRIVLRDTVKKIPYAVDFTIRNNDSVVIDWSFNTDPLEALKGALQLVPVMGKLAPGEISTVRAVFSPRENITYSCTLPLAIAGMDKPYLELEVRGTGAMPRLCFDTREVALPAVPLGVKATAKFTVINQGYDNLELKYKLPVDQTRVPIEVHFPEGIMIGIAKARLPVEVSFVSDKPMSFTARIDFTDDGAGVFSIPVTGTADACLLTTHHFVQTNESLLRLDAPSESKAVMLVPGVEGFRMPVVSEEALSSASASPALLRWLSATTSRAWGDVGNMPMEMVACKGRAMVDLVELLSGKPFAWSKAGVGAKTSIGNSNTVGGNKHNSRKEQAMQLLGQYDRLLVHLRSCGALLNAVKPEFLLDLEDFKRVLAAREQDKDKDKAVDETDIAHWRRLEGVWAHVSAAAWYTVATQVVRVFALSRVTARALKALPGTGGEGCPPVVVPVGGDAGSNIYSPGESVLLRWASHHFRIVLPSCYYRLTNFTTHLRDGLALFSLLASHRPSLRANEGALHRPCRDESQVRENARLVVSLYRDLSLAYPLDEDDILRPQPRESLLFLLYLWSALPQLIPRQPPVSFAGRLGETLLKHIELTNPGTRPVAYLARLAGAKDFDLPASYIRLEPRSRGLFAVQCTPQVAKAQEARLTLTSVKSNNAGAGAPAATLVFALMCQVHSRTPLRTLEVAAAMYEYVTQDMEVVNPFPGECDFAVSVVAKPPEGGEMPSVPVVDGGGSVTTTWPMPFGCDKTRLKLRQGETGKLIFVDAEFGEFTYLLIGDARLPTPAASAPVRFQCEAAVSASAGNNNNVIVRELPVPWVSQQFEAAKRMFMERHPGATGVQEGGVASRTVKYSVRSSSPYVSVPAEVVLYEGAREGGSGSGTKTPAGGKSGGGGGGGGGGGEGGGGGGGGGGGEVAGVTVSNCVPLTLNHKGPGVYPVRLLLTSPLDVRLLDAELSLSSSSSRSSLDFECPARGRCSQDIPIVNANGDRPLTASARLTGNNAFGGPSEVTVPAGQNGAYSVTFRPAWMGECTGEEPLSEGLIVIDCQARKTTSKTIQVPNIGGDGGRAGSEVIYTVTSDLPLSNPEPRTLRVVSDRPADYELQLSPARSGVALGSVTFTAPNGRYVWFAIEVRAAPPPAEDVVVARTAVRSPVTLEIHVNNPVDHPVTFEVVLQAREAGHGLVGPKKLQLEAREMRAYEFAYLPLRPGEEEGAVHFFSDSVGEYWYRLELAADAAPPTHHAVTFNNPLDVQVALRSASSNPRNFTLVPNTITLPARGSAEARVEYTPSSLNVEEEAEIEAGDAAVGSWVFRCRGRGTPPTMMEPQVVGAMLGQTVSSLVTFRNPFPVPLQVAISLSDASRGGKDGTEDTSSANDVMRTPPFRIMLKRQRNVTLAPFAFLQIPVSFTPGKCDEITEYKAELTVEMEEDLAWRYPIVGVSEAPPSGMSIRFQCRARSAMHEEVELPLHGLRLSSSRPESVTHSLVLPDTDATALRRALTVQPIITDIAVVEGEGEAEGAVPKAKYRVSFQPQKATEPVLDGVITIESLVNHTGTAVIHIPSPLHTPAPCIAFFGPDSPPEFGISPSRAMVRPMTPDDPGTPFTVSFSPREYGRVLVARLIIQTEEMDWMYEIRGTRPQYVAPVAVSRIENKLSAEVERQLAQSNTSVRRNIIRDNAASAGGRVAGARRQRQ
eukprot:jgi/Chlat1/5143/Chrsp33S08970